MTTNSGFKYIVIYVSLAIVITLIVYYIPSYFVLKSSIAYISSFVLSFLGVNAPLKILAGHVFLGSYEIVRDCTGIQVIAVFLGLILPLPKTSWIKKLYSFIVLGTLLYFANIFRVVLEYWLVENGILPWSLAHYPLSFILGVIGVFFLVVVNNIIMPEFGDHIDNIIKKMRCLVGSR
jgi:exosortase/archaeosortase family protein